MGKKLRFLPNIWPKRSLDYARWLYNEVALTLDSLKLAILRKLKRSTSPLWINLDETDRKNSSFPKKEVKIVTKPAPFKINKNCHKAIGNLLLKAQKSEDAR